MDTGGYVGWKPATLEKGKYEVKVYFAENFTGKNADENGEISTGMNFQYEVIGPAESKLTNGASAVGFRFDELMLEPKRNSSLKYIEMCNSKWSAMLKAIFGDNIPPRVEPEDFIDRVLVVSTHPKWSDFKQAEVPEIGFRQALV